MWSIETDTSEHAAFFRAYFTAHPEELWQVRRVTDPVTGEWDIHFPPMVMLSFLEWAEKRGLVGRPENVPGLRAGLRAAVQGDPEPLEKHLRETT